jgi:Ca2+-binding RTX toxin-like protein
MSDLSSSSSTVRRGETPDLVRAGRWHTVTVRMRALGTVAISTLLIGVATLSASGETLGTLGGPGCTISGTTRNDELRGTDGRDVICTGRGDDFIEGMGGNDLIHAGPGSDLVDAGFGADTVSGGGGPDILLGEEGPDDLSGGPGRDDVRGGLGRDRIAGGSGNDRCLSAIDDRPGDDVIGGPGNDTADYDPGDDVRSVEHHVAFFCFGE